MHTIILKLLRIQPSVYRYQLLCTIKAWITVHIKRQQNCSPDKREVETRLHVQCASIGTGVTKLSKRAIKAFSAQEFIKCGFSWIITKGNEILQCVPCCVELLNQAFKTYIVRLKAHWSLHVPPRLTFTNNTLCPHSVFMCFVWI